MHQLGNVIYSMIIHVVVQAIVRGINSGTKRCQNPIDLLTMHIKSLLENVVHLVSFIFLNYLFYHNICVVCRTVLEKS